MYADSPYDVIAITSDEEEESPESPPPVLNNQVHSPLAEQVSELQQETLDFTNKLDSEQFPLFVHSPDPVPLKNLKRINATKATEHQSSKQTRPKKKTATGRQDVWH